MPDPICWTEAPESLAVLRSQRMRWQRGLLESLWLNSGLLFHPRGGAPGWLAFPMMALFEAVGPLVEGLGLAVAVAAFAGGAISSKALVAFLLAAMAMGILLSTSALLLEEMSFHLYRRPGHLVQLLAAMLAENLGYRQLTAWWRLRALLRWLFRRKGSWGEMRRTASWQAPRPQ